MKSVGINYFLFEMLDKIVSNYSETYICLAESYLNAINFQENWMPESRVFILTNHKGYNFKSKNIKIIPIVTSDAKIFRESIIHLKEKVLYDYFNSKYKTLEGFLRAKRRIGEQPPATRTVIPSS